MGATFVTGNRTTFGFATERMLRLSFAQMAIVGAAILLLLVGGLVVASPVFGYGAVLALLLGILLVRDPLYSILSFVVINVVLMIRPKANLPGAAPTPFDLALGLILAVIIGYWLLRIRLLEGDRLNSSASQLAISLFFVWAVIVTAIGFLDGNNSFPLALREVLNLSPLLILPILYERFIESDSSDERLLIWAVLIAGGVLLAWNILHIRNTLVHAVYMYETGRGSADQDLSGFLVLIATSLFMSRHRRKLLVPIGILFLGGCVGIIISLFRGLYIATAVCIIWMIFSGNAAERRRGIFRVAITVCSGSLVMIPLVAFSRVLRLLLLNYSHRFLSSQHLGMDLSLRARYAEWAYEWKAILHAPVFGYGFGSRWRVFDIILHFNSWMAFSHSSYFYIILKSGFIGFLLFFLAYFGFMLKGYKLLRSSAISETSRAVLRAGIAFLIFILIDAYTEPVFDGKTDLIWVGLIWGYFLALERSMKLHSPTLEVDSVPTMRRLAA